MPWTKEEYERERREFRWDIPADYSIAQAVDDHAWRHPEKPAVVWESEAGERRTLSWGSFPRDSPRS